MFYVPEKIENMETETCRFVCKRQISHIHKHTYRTAP